MRVMPGDTVWLLSEREIGRLEALDNDIATVRTKDGGLQSVRIRHLVPFAERIALAVRAGRKTFRRIDLRGKATAMQLIDAFGVEFALEGPQVWNSVKRQLSDAGLILQTTGGSDWRQTYRITFPTGKLPERKAGTEIAFKTIEFPKVFWPSLLGLPEKKEISFLRALWEPEGVLCLLDLRGKDYPEWIQPYWEGILAWAFRAAQRFGNSPEDRDKTEVRVRPPGLLQSFFTPSMLDITESSEQRLDTPHTLTLLTMRKDTDYPLGFQRLQSVWGGKIFEFSPTFLESSCEEIIGTIRSLTGILLKTVGIEIEDFRPIDPMKGLLWCRNACTEIEAQSLPQAGGIFRESIGEAGRKNDKTTRALSLKLRMVQFLAGFGKPILSEKQQPPTGDGGNPETAISLFTADDEVYDIETLIEGETMEAFYLQRILPRIATSQKFSLVVPNEAFLWGGPFLADIAFQLEGKGSVLLPSLTGGFRAILPRKLELLATEIPWDEIAARWGNLEKPLLPRGVSMRDVGGYEDVKQMLEELVIFPEKYMKALSLLSKTSGLIFFGPPGCGKSLLARAIGGELDQQMRLLGPADLRGPFLSWGQVMIREQFDWLAETPGRILVIDELESVARTRFEPLMHSDEKANVNELLVQLDRAATLGRLVIGTTNFIDSFDASVLRNGRFGRFIPIPPPTINDAIAILHYYLERLTHQKDIQILVPTKAELEKGIREIYLKNARKLRFFGGADFEEIVNRLVQRTYRQFIRTTKGRGSVLTVGLSDLLDTFSEVSCSVTPEILAAFLLEVDKYCGNQKAHRIEKSLGISDGALRRVTPTLKRPPISPG